MGLPYSFTVFLLPTVSEFSLCWNLRDSIQGSTSWNHFGGLDWHLFVSDLGLSQDENIIHFFAPSFLPSLKFPLFFPYINEFHPYWKIWKWPKIVRCELYYMNDDVLYQCHSAKCSRGLLVCIRALHAPLLLFSFQFGNSYNCVIHSHFFYELVF